MPQRLVAGNVKSKSFDHLVCTRDLFTLEFATCTYLTSLVANPNPQTNVVFNQPDSEAGV